MNEEVFNVHEYEASNIARLSAPPKLMDRFTAILIKALSIIL